MLHLGTVGRAVTVLQELDSPLRTYQQLVLQPAVEVDPAAADGVQVLGEVPDDIAWVMPPPPATTGHLPGRRRRLLRGAGGLLSRLRGQDALALLDAAPTRCSPSIRPTGSCCTTGPPSGCSVIGTPR